MRQIRKALSLDDVLLEPAYSDIHPSKVDISTVVGSIRLPLPILSAAMDTLTGLEMAGSLGDLGGCGIIHKNMSIDEQSEIAHKLSKLIVTADGSSFKFGVAIGVGEMERFLALYPHAPDFIVIDAAHGDTKAMIDFFVEIKEKCNITFDPYSFIVGNITTASAAHRLYNAGVRIVKLGQIRELEKHGFSQTCDIQLENEPSFVANNAVVHNAICSTRIVAGIGVPQFQAVRDIYEMKIQNEYHDLHIIADGGLRYTGDIVKILAAGADAVMLGGMLAGTTEALGGNNYRGMGSIPAMEAGSAGCYNQSGDKKLTPEGVEGTVHLKGPLHEVIKQIDGGIRAGMGYTGSHNLQELRESNFIEITNSGLRESHPHSLLSIKSAPNYPV